MIATMETLFSRAWVALLARVLLTFPFWLSGLMKAIGFEAALAEMRHFGLEPPVPYALLTIVVQLTGSFLIITGRAAWLGAGALIVFTLLTIPIAHAFWTMFGQQAFLEAMVALEHVGLIGGLLLAACFCARRTQAA